MKYLILLLLPLSLGFSSVEDIPEEPMKDVRYWIFQLEDIEQELSTLYHRNMVCDNIIPIINWIDSLLRNYHLKVDENYNWIED